MTTYLLISGSVTIASLLLALAFSQKRKIGELREKEAKNDCLIVELSELKVQHLEKIQHLTTKIEMMQSSAESLEKAQHAAIQAAERTLRSLGTELTSQLLVAHQHENKNSQIQNDQKLARTSQEIKTEIQKLLGSINVLEKEVEKSSNSVETIRRSILSPVQSNNLTEITLSNILNACGLRADVDFRLQCTITKSGKQYRPDAVVFLPNSNFIVVDAKASKFFLEGDDEGQNLMRAMHRHLKELSEKDYEAALLEHLNIDTKSDYRLSTLMFLNTESMVEKIFSLDPNFLRAAWLKNILLVGPTGLMNMLSIAKNHILEAKQAENYRVIFSETKQLLATIETLAIHGQKLGGTIQSLVASYDKFAGSFNKGFLLKAKNLSKLGMQNKGGYCSNSLKRYELVSHQELNQSISREEASNLELIVGDSKCSGEN
jgi:DNA recombination protein RmuC